MTTLDVNQWLQLDNTPYAALPMLLSSLGIGLLIGVERERKRRVLAGIRTFPLVSLLGTMLAMLAAQTTLPWLRPAGLLSDCGLDAAGIRHSIETRLAAG